MSKENETIRRDILFIFALATHKTNILLSTQGKH